MSLLGSLVGESGFGENYAERGRQKNNSPILLDLSPVVCVAASVTSARLCALCCALTTNKIAAPYREVIFIRPLSRRRVGNRPKPKHHQRQHSPPCRSSTAITMMVKRPRVRRWFGRPQISLMRLNISSNDIFPLRSLPSSRLSARPRLCAWSCTILSSMVLRATRR